MLSEGLVLFDAANNVRLLTARSIKNGLGGFDLINQLRENFNGYQNIQAPAKVHKRIDE